MNIDLQLFVKEALNKGIDRSSIETVLHQAGWQSEEIRAAIHSFAEVDFPIPVPRRLPHISAREAFLYLVLFMTLAISAVSLGTILFQLINRWLPDPVSAYDSVYYIESVNSILRTASASLIVAFPIFLYVSNLTLQGIAKNPDLRLSLPRIFITYLALFFASAIIIGTLITLLTNVLGGELTTRFLLKTASVLAISGSIFGYYLTDLKRAEEQQKA
jgi:small basic protein